jgi:[ribosomal protein S5]-alanine N-acetyltransferase
MNFRIRLRPWTLEDIPAVARYSNNKKIADNLRDAFPHPYSINNAEKFVHLAMNDIASRRYFAIDHDGHAIGSIGAVFNTDIYTGTAEFGYWLAEEYWGKGIITIAIKLIVVDLFESTDIRKLYAEPFAPNLASRRALEKAGFTCEGVLRKHVIKNGVVMDCCIYSILREEYLAGKMTPRESIKTIGSK